MPADNEIASALEIREGATVCKIRRLRSGGGQPIGILTAKRGPGILDIAEPMSSLYAMLRDRFGLMPQSALEIYRAGRGVRSRRRTSRSCARQSGLRRSAHYLGRARTL